MGGYGGYVPDRHGEGDGDGAGGGEGDAGAYANASVSVTAMPGDDMEADAGGEAECGGVGLADAGGDTGTAGRAEGSGLARAALLVPARVAGPPKCSPSTSTATRAAEPRRHRWAVMTPLST